MFLSYNSFGTNEFKIGSTFYSKIYFNKRFLKYGNCFVTALTNKLLLNKIIYVVYN